MRRLVIVLSLLLMGAKAAPPTVYQRAEVEVGGKADPTKKLKFVLLIEDLGMQNGSWLRNLTVKPIAPAGATQTLNYVYTPLKPGKYKENLVKSTMVGEATLLGKPNAWAELKIRRKNLCTASAFPIQDFKTKNCDIEQQWVCTSDGVGSACTELFLKGTQSIKEPLKINFVNIDQKTFLSEIEKK